MRYLLLVDTLFCLLLLGAACTINTLCLRLAICSKQGSTLFCWKELDGWIDIHIEGAGRLFDGYLLLPPILLNIYKHKKV
jgi:hypothetical protein